MYKDYMTVLIEAIIVGVLLVALYNIIKYVLPSYSHAMQLCLAGALFHILCEILGINVWYVKNYVELLKL